MQYVIYKKILVTGLIILFFAASIVPGISQNVEKNTSDEISSFYEENDVVGASSFSTPDDDWDYWSNSPNMFANVSGNVGIGISNPTNKLHIVGSDYAPLLNIDKNGPGRGMRVNTSSACAIWVENSGNHGIRIQYAAGDGIHVMDAGGWAGWFDGKGYFSENLSIGTENPDGMLEVAGIIHSSSGGFKFPDGTIQTSAATGSAVGNTLDQAYDEGGPGAGRTITADSGALNIEGPDGLTVQGNAQASGLLTNDLFFKNNGNDVWRMFGDETNLYVENILTGNIYRLVILRSDNINQESSINSEIEELRAENQALMERIETIEQMILGE